MQLNFENEWSENVASRDQKDLTDIWNCKKTTLAHQNSMNGFVHGAI